jgi:hypothetical protein
MRFATFLSWLLTVGLGAFMLRTWLARGGPQRERARADGLPPQLIAGHAGLALVGLVIWVAYLASGARVLAWTAVGVLTVTVGLGLCTVTLWTPYPARKPGERRASARDEPAVVVPETAAGAAEGADSPQYQITDEMIERLIDEPRREYAAWHRPARPDLAVLVPIAHGFAALGTFVLAVMTAATM